MSGILTLTHETVEVRVAFKIGYEADKPGAREHALTQIRVFQDTLGNSPEFGMFEVESLQDTVKVP